MPVNPTYPGVYIEEISSGVHTITGVATSVAAFVDFFPQGPVNEAVEIFSWADFERQFGGLDERSEASYAIQQFFLNGGTQAYVVRATSNTTGNAAAAAAIAIEDGNGTVVLTVTAASPGVWGNNIRVAVDFGTTDPTSLFNLTITEISMASGSPQVVASETYRNLSLDSTLASYVVSSVNNASQLVSVALATSSTTRPAQTGTLTEGFTYLSLIPWAATTTFIAGQEIIDPNGNLEKVKIGGTTGATQPAWPTTVGNVSPPDGTVTWLLVAKGVATPEWATGHPYLVGDRIFDPAGNIQKATTAATSAAAPIFPTIVGNTVNDNGITWQLMPTGLGFLPSWASSRTYITDAAIIDSNGNMQAATTPGKTGTVQPTWSKTIGGTTTDNGVTWTLSMAKRLKLDLNSSMTVALNSNPAFPKPIQLVSAPPTALSWGWLAAALQTQLRLVDPSLANATVSVVGSASSEVFLQFKPGTGNSTDALTFSGTLATALGIGTTTTNVQQYALGSGIAVDAQQLPGSTPTVQAGTDGIWDASSDATGMTGGLIGDQLQKTGMYALLNTDIFNILCIPASALLPDTDAAQVSTDATALCVQRRAFYILDAPQQSGDRDTFNGIKNWLDQNSSLRSRNAALYFPRADLADPLNNYQLRPTAPSGTIAGLYARTDASRGVWKAPAGTETSLIGVQKLEYTLIDGENGVLNPLAINCLRSFPVYGPICWGARTLYGADQLADDYKYIPIRRFALFLEESLYRGSQWVVFEPNDEPLWAQIRLNVGAFLHGLFRQGAFQGSTPQAAYFVKCDDETTTQNDINNGIVNIIVGFAPLKPAEFVIIQIQQIAGQIQT